MQEISTASKVEFAMAMRGLVNTIRSSQELISQIKERNHVRKKEIIKENPEINQGDEQKEIS